MAARETTADRLSRGVYVDTGRVCRAPGNEIYIACDGQVYPCVNPTLIIDTSCGDVGRSDLAAIQNGERFQMFKKLAGTLPYCANCIAKRE